MIIFPGAYGAPNRPLRKQNVQSLAELITSVPSACERPLNANGTSSRVYAKRQGPRDAPCDAPRGSESGRSEISDISGLEEGCKAAIGHGLAAVISPSISVLRLTVFLSTDALTIIR